jgi:hypothetical protein
MNKNQLLFNGNWDHYNILKRHKIRYTCTNFYEENTEFPNEFFGFSIPNCPWCSFTEDNVFVDRVNEQ